jgi:voltage-gated potassium channel
MWLLFIGTAYQMVIEKFLEEYQMKKLEKKLFNHTIICGYGSTGQAACNELILTQKDKNSIIIIDNNEDALKKAVTDGLSCIQGDATKEVFLGYSIIEKAKNIIICLGRDDSNILTCLTVKNMNPDVRIIVSIELNENMKIAQKAGADVIVLPAVAGGRLLAGACEKMYSSRFLEDLLTNNGNVSIAEHTITQDSDGSFLKDYTSQTVLAIYRSSKYISALPETKIKKDDVLIFLNNKNISKY